MVDVRQTSEYAQYMSKIGWKAEVKSNVFYFIKSFYFSSVLKIPRPESLDIAAILEVAKNNRSLQIIVEPKDEDQESSLKKNKFNKAPSLSSISKTLHVDLTNSKEKIMSEFAKDAKEYLAKTADLRIYSVENVNKFQESWRASVPIFRHVPSVKSLSYLKNAFGKNALFLITPDGGSGAIFLKGKDSVHYWQAFTAKGARKNYSQYKIVWSAISWAKNLGVKIFDLEGIYDERYPRNDWRGFTHFKKSFGGKEVYYPPVYTKLQFNFRLMI